MTRCIKIKRKKTQVCIGSLNKKIDLYTRIITPAVDPADSLIDYDNQFTLLKRVWALIEKPVGLVIFDGIEAGGPKVTHQFYIRYFDGITQQDWIGYNSNRYNILNVVILEEQKLFYRLDAYFRGDISKDASKG